MFSELGLIEPILRAVKAAGYVTPTPIQLQAIPPVIAGRDLLGCAQTGTGKTAAFALPILHRLAQAGNPARGSGRRIRVLVLSPTRELAAQIGQSFASYACYLPTRSTVIFGGVNQNSQTRALRHGVDILVATPGRLLDLINQGFVDLKAVEIFVLDEADRMMDMGFLPDVRRVIGRLPAKRQTLFFSATMPPPIHELARTLLHHPIEVRIAPAKAEAGLVEQSVFHVAKREKPDLLAHLLSSRAVTRALVFTRTKHGADQVARRLNRSGIPADALHGNKSQAARQRALANFKQSEMSVLVATDIAARGIDVEGISHVLNYDLPHEPETYVHRIGRTGRAGARGVAFSLCDHEERKHLQAIEQLLRRRLPVDPASEPAPCSTSEQGDLPLGRRGAHRRPAVQVGPGERRLGGKKSYRHQRPSSRYSRGLR